MNAVLEAPAVEAPRQKTRNSSGHVSIQIRTLLSGAGLFDTPQRRQSQRFPFPHLVWLTPVDPVDDSPLGEPLAVVGKHLSEDGLGFYHREPLAARHVIAMLEVRGSTPIRVLLDLNWCRFARGGWYESGGRFLRVVEE